MEADRKIVSANKEPESDTSIYDMLTEKFKPFDEQGITQVTLVFTAWNTQKHMGQPASLKVLIEGPKAAAKEHDIRKENEEKAKAQREQEETEQQRLELLEQNKRIEEQNKQIQDQLLLTQLNSKQVAIVEANSSDLDKEVQAVFQLNWRDLLFEGRLGSGSFGDCYQGRYVLSFFIL